MPIFKEDRFTDEMIEKVERERREGEQILWFARAIPRFFVPATGFAYLFGIPWTAFSIFWILGAAGVLDVEPEGGLGWAALFGVPFIIVGLGILGTPFYAYWKQMRVFHVITDQRAILFSDSGEIRSFHPRDLRHVQRRERKDGTGDIVMALGRWRDSDGDEQTEEIGFMGVREPRTVERMLRNLSEQGEETPEDADESGHPSTMPIIDREETHATDADPAVALGKIITVLLFAALLTAWVHPAITRDTEEARNMTLEQYIDTFDEYKEEAEKDPGSALFSFVVAAFMAALLFGAYESVAALITLGLRKMVFRDRSLDRQG
ncbi:MAG: hypothetical protein ACLFOY_12540 [Desulfatibacillaceae bacterium]